MQVIGSKFTSGDQKSDFNWMIEQPKYADALFIFNDNEEQFLEHRNNPGSKTGDGCRDGEGNAGIRHYQCQDLPRAAGIPTGGSKGGYQKLDERTKSGKSVQALIDEALDTIKEVAQKNNYQRIFYSAEPNGDLGTGIFKVGIEVKKYIVKQLMALATSS
jgi:hypothetical protein